MINLVSSSEYCRVGQGRPASNRPVLGTELMLLTIVIHHLVFLLLLAGFQRIFVSLIRFKGRAQFCDLRQRPFVQLCRINS